jgi:hypothetical protein
MSFILCFVCGDIGRGGPICNLSYSESRDEEFEVSLSEKLAEPHLNQ